MTELRRCCRQAIHREIDDYLLAAIFGQLDAAKILIQAGADLNSQNNMGGTALQKTGCADASLPVNRTIAVLVQEHKFFQNRSSNLFHFYQYYYFYKLLLL